MLSDGHLGNEYFSSDEIRDLMGQLELGKAAIDELEEEKLHLQASIEELRADNIDLIDRLEESEEELAMCRDIIEDYIKKVNNLNKLIKSQRPNG